LPSEAPDIALVSLGTTPGLVHSDESFASLVRAAGASCEVVPVRIGPVVGALRRHVAVTDLVEALAARRAAAVGSATAASASATGRSAAGRSASGTASGARAVVFSTITAALLARAPEQPYAIRFDATASLNRRGWGGAWQRAAEKRPLRGARLLLPVSRGAEAAVPVTGVPVVRLPIPIEPLEGSAERDIDAVAYAGYPRKRGLELLCAAWASAGVPGGRFVIGGLDRAKGVAWLDRCGVPEPAGVEWAGSLPRAEWLSLVGRARVYVNASRWEDFGLGPLEALSAGTPLVTVPTPGSFEALPLARELEPELVSEDLAIALRAGLALDEAARSEYARRAAKLLEPYRAEHLVDVVRNTVLPALGLA
jgi:glycosyltransferase involved in cell wall biosynthesis